VSGAAAPGDRVRAARRAAASASCTYSSRIRDFLSSARDGGKTERADRLRNAPRTTESGRRNPPREAAADGPPSKIVSRPSRRVHHRAAPVARAATCPSGPVIERLYRAAPVGVLADNVLVGLACPPRRPKARSRGTEARRRDAHRRVHFERQPRRSGGAGQRRGSPRRCAGSNQTAVAPRCGPVPCSFTVVSCLTRHHVGVRDHEPLPPPAEPSIAGRMRFRHLHDACGRRLGPGVARDPRRGRAPHWAWAPVMDGPGSKRAMSHGSSCPTVEARRSGPVSIVERLMSAAGSRRRGVWSANRGAPTRSASQFKPLQDLPPDPVEHGRAAADPRTDSKPSTSSIDAAMPPIRNAPVEARPALTASAPPRDRARPERDPRNAPPRIRRARARRRSGPCA